jgi:hypothetical protein
MDSHRFDDIVKTLGHATTRRTLLKALIGLGSVGAAGRVLQDAEAARRGYSGPTVPTPTEPARDDEPIAPETCPGIVCDGECCPKQQTECCQGVCCAGTCYDGVLCCPQGMGPCPGGGCCGILGPRVGPR